MEVTVNRQDFYTFILRDSAILSPGIELNEGKVRLTMTPCCPAFSCMSSAWACKQLKYEHPNISPV